MKTPYKWLVRLRWIEPAEPVKTGSIPFFNPPEADQRTWGITITIYSISNFIRQDILVKVLMVAGTALITKKGK